ncbi:MAG: hypothetical protein HYZ81_27400 [Nitrospinae bacterium]|nr:hypothetical protein [Nitrospinota bacterium]
MNAYRNAWTPGDCVGLVVALLVMTTAAVWGLDTNQTRATLRGLTGVHVMVEEISPEIKRAGLTTTQLQTDAELRLRKAGIRVLTQEESLATPGGPYLYIRVTGLKDETVTGRPLGYAAFTEVSLHQNVRLARDPAITAVGAQTWNSASRIWLVDSAKVRLIRESVADQVDEFINATWP